MSTSIVPQPDDLRQLVESGKIDYDDLMNLLAQRNKAKASDEVPPAPQSPKLIVLSDDDKKTLRTLPAQLADLVLPGSARVLTEAEREILVPLFDKVKKAKAAVTKAEDALKQAMHGHIDASTTSNELDGNGHKLTEGEVVAPGYDKKVVRGVNGGNAHTLTNFDLRAMVSDKVITTAQYLRMTKAIPAPRIPVSEAIMAEIKKDPSLLDAFASRARLSDRTTAIRMAKN